jgi:hypothetical protein
MNLHVCLIHWVLNVYPREQARQIHTESLIVGITIEQFVIRNPINYASSLYRMSNEETNA